MTKHSDCVCRFGMIFTNDGDSVVSYGIIVGTSD